MWPEGSVTVPIRSPQNMFSTGCFTVAPAETARSKAFVHVLDVDVEADGRAAERLRRRPPSSPGISSPSMKTESPIFISAWAMPLPSGVGMRNRSSAPNASL